MLVLQVRDIKIDSRNSKLLKAPFLTGSLNFGAIPKGNRDSQVWPYYLALSACVNCAILPHVPVLEIVPLVVRLSILYFAEWSQMDEKSKDRGAIKISAEVWGWIEDQKDRVRKATGKRPTTDMVIRELFASSNDRAHQLLDEFLRCGADKEEVLRYLEKRAALVEQHKESAARKKRMKGFDPK